MLSMPRVTACLAHAMHPPPAFSPMGPKTASSAARRGGWVLGLAWYLLIRSPTRLYGSQAAFLTLGTPAAGQPSALANSGMPPLSHHPSAPSQAGGVQAGRVHQPGPAHPNGGSREQERGAAVRGDLRQPLQWPLSFVACHVKARCLPDGAAAHQVMAVLDYLHAAGALPPCRSGSRSGRS